MNKTRQANKKFSCRKPSNKEEVAKVYAWIYTHCSSFRSSCYIITGIWAVGLLLEFLARLTLILVHLPLSKLVIYGNVILSGVTAICIALTITFIAKERKQTIAFIQQWKNDHLNVRESLGDIAF